MRLYVWIFFISLPLVNIAQSKTDQAILDTEKHRFELMVQHDTIALSRLLATDLFYIHANGLQENKAAHLSALASGRLVYTSMKREFAQVRRYGKIAVTNGVLQVKAMMNNNYLESRLIYTAVYRQEHGQWKLVNWQSTKAQ